METLTLWAAGSLRAAVTEITGRFRDTYNISVRTEFGPSGLLRQRIESGELPDIFASADMGHPITLNRKGLAGPPVVFAHNGLCAYGRPNSNFHTKNLIDYLLDPKVRLGTSTPVADPGGDYAWEVFRLAGKLRAGAYDSLSAKAQTLVGGPNTSAPIKGQSPVIGLFEQNVIDVFLGYRTTAVQIISKIPDLVIVDLPSDLKVRTNCGLTVLDGVLCKAAWLAMFILSEEGQSVLQKFGFETAGPD